MKKENGKQNSSRFLALVLAAGFLVTLVALAAAPSLFAQDDVDGGTDSDIYIISSQEDVDALPPHVRERMQKGIIYGAAGSHDVSQSTKTAGRDVVLPNEEVNFTIIARNSGDDQTDVTVVDALPEGLTYVSHEFKIPDGGIEDPSSGVSGNVVTWEGTLGINGSVEILIVAQVEKKAEVGTEYTNTAVITAGDKTAEPATTLTVVEDLPSVHLPVITYGKKPLTPDILSIEATRPNSQNLWTVSWNGAGAVAYELQESMSPGFENAVPIDVGPQATMSFNHPPSPYNEYYYRVRSKAGGVTGNWSETLKVNGGYRDDFEDPNSGWEHDRNDIENSGMRRITHLDLVNAWYEFEPNDIKWHLLEVHDRFDLGLVSPLREAPSIPYAIQLEMKSPDPANMNGMGFVFAGDKRTDNCPQDRYTVEGWYEHEDCFNQFYEVMLIENPAGEKRDLIVQRVAEVKWIGSGGSIPAHRVVDKKWKDEDLSGVSWGDWDVLRAEVYADHIDIFIGERGKALKHRITMEENMYTANPFFGTIATTQERPKATARFDYFEVMPLDN